MLLETIDFQVKLWYGKLNYNQNCAAICKDNHLYCIANKCLHK